MLKASPRRRAYITRSRAIGLIRVVAPSQPRMDIIGAYNVHNVHDFAGGDHDCTEMTHSDLYT